MVDLVLIEQRLTLPAHDGHFAEADVRDLPDGARRMLPAAIAPGTRLAASLRLRMRGSIKLNRWLPFRATEVIAPGVGFVWRARVAGIVAGYDRYIDGQGEMQWKLAGLVTVAQGSGADVSRSAAGREVGETFWLPTALLPQFGTEWLPADDDHAIARIRTAAEPIDVTYTLDASGRVRSLTFQRWGDPDDRGEFAFHTFGGTTTEHRTFGGLTIPSKGTVGWSFGEEGWETGEFFRFQITDAHPVG